MIIEERGENRPFLVLGVASHSGNLKFMLTTDSLRYTSNTSKGALNWNRILGCVLANHLNSTSLFFITVQDTAWNSLQAKKHPILWRLGFIQRSQNGIWALGEMDNKNELVEVRDVLERLRVPVFEGNIQSKHLLEEIYSKL